MSEIANTNVTSTGLIKGCKRGGCWLNGIVHNLYTCVSEQLKRQCCRTGCTITGIHPLEECNPQLLEMVKNNTAVLCNESGCEYIELHGAHDCNPQLMHDNGPTILATASKEIVLYTGPNLVHVGTICDDAECVIEGRHTVAAHVLCQNPSYPIGNDHLTDTNCENYRAKSQYQTPRNRRDKFPSQTANKITSKMRLKRFAGKIRSTWQSLREDWVYLIACIPLILGVLNSVYALGMLHGTTAQVMDTPVFNPIAVIISASFYALVLMFALDFMSKHQEIPAESSFNHYLNHLRTGTAFLATSCAFEVAGFLFERR